MFDLLFNVLQVEVVFVGFLYVDNVMFYVDLFYSYCVVLIVVNQVVFEVWVKKVGVDYFDFVDLCLKLEICKEVFVLLNQVRKIFDELKLIFFGMFLVI